MIIDWNKCRHLTVITCYWLGLLMASGVDALKIVQREDDNTNNIQAAPPAGFESHVFNPRVDYNNEWRPVGRGDPLKNDPTFDYSPPALERVRYWADNSGSEKEKKEKKETLLTTQHGGDNNKNDLSHLSDRMRQNPNSIGVSKNEKQSGIGIGNQPMRYTSIRRSYYAHQLPTRLMPPPMHSNSVGQMSAKSSTVEPAAPSTYQHYHQNVQYSSTGTPSKPYYSTAVTSPWTAAYSTHTIATHKMPMPYVDVRPEESINYLSITRPDYVHSNILSNANDFKQSPTPARKPWVHHLLQKEVIKPPLTKPHTMSSAKYTMHPTKPFFTGSSIYSSKGSASQPTYQTTTTTTTRTTMPTTMPTTTISTAIYVPTTTISTPIYVPTTPRSTTVPSTQTVPFSAIQNKSTASPAFLITTNTANLTTYPTVAPMKLTTDSLFSHYNQPEKPLIGPMYLIIEGHSKVKTYGKNGNESTTHEPKIVPIIPKREPIVHHVVSHDERGINFQVKHLHTKPAAQITTTPTWTRTTTTTTTSTMTINDKMIKATTMPTPTTIEEKNATNAGDPPTGMQGLLSLLDSSLGNFFLNDDTQSDGYSRERIPPKAIAQPTIFVTTTTGRPRVATNNRRRLDNVVDLLPPSPRESRQIFDYDQLPESRLKELTNGHSPPEDLSLRSSSSVGDVEDDDDGNDHELDDHNLKNP